MFWTTLAGRGIDPWRYEVLMGMLRITTKDPFSGWNVERLE
jgi:hypothetical protein